MEFGEQLRKAREDKGMTQQNLADKIFVTRQSVSRWERGERYPDLLMIKKISGILGISIDELLSEEDLTPVSEKSPAMKNRLETNRFTALYVSICICYFVVIIELFLNIKNFGQLTSKREYFIQGTQVLRCIVETLAFSYGSFCVIHDLINPKKEGIIAVTFWAMEGLLDFVQGMYSNWQFSFLSIHFILVEIFAVIATYYLFIKNSKNQIWHKLVFSTVLFGIFRALFTFTMNVLYASAYISTMTIVALLLKIGVFSTIFLQTMIICKSRGINNERHK